MNWFGDPWNRAGCPSAERTEAPVGVRCLHCGEAVALGDRGLFFCAPIHLL